MNVVRYDYKRLFFYIIYTNSNFNFLFTYNTYIYENLFIKVQVFLFDFSIFPRAISSIYLPIFVFILFYFILLNLSFKYKKAIFKVGRRKLSSFRKLDNLVFFVVFFGVTIFSLFTIDYDALLFCWLHYVRTFLKCFVFHVFTNQPTNQHINPIQILLLFSCVLMT